MKLKTKELAAIRSHLQNIYFLASVSAESVRINVKLIEEILDRKNGKEKDREETEGQVDCEESGC